jgi:4-amino-4-deoxy-L-arabinose transferase-like glycosyltransferase
MRLDARRHAPLLITAWWVALTIAVIVWRPLTPVDETRYASVAWEMWQSGDWLQLRLNGELYGHKPPLLFWLINLGWSVLGVNAWWPRLLTALFAAGGLALVWRLARTLAPARDVALIALFISASALYWCAFTGALMFDMMLAFFVLLGVLGIGRAANVGGWRPWLSVGIALGLGILSKGPVALVHLLPLALLAPWWTAASAGRAEISWSRWYGGVGFAVLVGAAIALAWAVPAALAGGASFGQEIFWNQSVDRIAHTNHHQRPAWFYLAAVPLLAIPWLLLPATWSGFAALARAPSERITRFALAWCLPAVVVFSTFSAKQVQYLLPEVPALALLVAAALAARDRAGVAPRRADLMIVAGAFAALAAALAVLMGQDRLAHLVESAEQTSIGLTIAAIGVIAVVLALQRPREHVTAAAMLGTSTVLLVVVCYAGVVRVLFDNYDLRSVARHLAQAQAAGRSVAHFSKYHGQYQFLGRLSRPIRVIDWPHEMLAWADQNPDGVAVVYSYRPLVHPSAQPEFRHRFGGRQVYVWRAADLRGVSDGWFKGLPTDDDAQ